MNTNILILEDDQDDIFFLDLKIKELGFHNVNIVSTKLDFLKIINESIGVIILDDRLGADSGYDVLDAIMKVVPSAVTVLMTGSHDLEVGAKYWNRGVDYCIVKSPGFEDLEFVLKMSVDKAKQKQNFFAFLKSQQDDARSIRQGY